MSTYTKPVEMQIRQRVTCKGSSFQMTTHVLYLAAALPRCRQVVTRLAKVSAFFASFSKASISCCSDSSHRAMRMLHTALPFKSRICMTTPAQSMLAEVCVKCYPSPVCKFVLVTALELSGVCLNVLHAVRLLQTPWTDSARDASIAQDCGI